MAKYASVLFKSLFATLVYGCVAEGPNVSQRFSFHSKLLILMHARIFFWILTRGLFLTITTLSTVIIHQERRRSAFHCWQLIKVQHFTKNLPFFGLAVLQLQLDYGAVTLYWAVGRELEFAESAELYIGGAAPTLSPCQCASMAPPSLPVCHLCQYGTDRLLCYGFTPTPSAVAFTCSMWRMGHLLLTLFSVWCPE